MANLFAQTLNKRLDKQPEKAGGLLQLALFGLGWLGLSVIALLVTLIVKAVFQGRYPDPLAFENAWAHISVPTTINVISYILLLFALTALSFRVLAALRHSFYRPSVIFKGIGYGGLILLSGILINVLYLVFKIQLTDNANEATITSMMRTYPLASFIAFVIAGPICEELTYRLGLFGLLGRFNKYVAYAVTYVFFSLIHFDFDTTNLINELLNLPFYVVAGLIFCYIYEKEGLTVSIYAHVTNNLISFVATFLASDVIVRII